MGDAFHIDTLINDDGPAALVIREHLIPADGPDGVIFPATYAGKDGSVGNYNVDLDTTGRTVCLIDSVGSQANRIEPIFMRDKYSHLVPQIQIVVKRNENEISILEVGHRAGDALLRCSTLQEEIEAAFRASIRGDAVPLAKLAPTSLVFGVWNSRGQKGDQDKRPRLIASTIRAFNVQKLSRSAVYAPPLDYSLLDVFSEDDKQKAEGDPKNPLSKRGFVNALATNTHGGIIADGGIRRDATLSLSAVRHLHSGRDSSGTLKLRRYILGLSLVAFTAPMDPYLRQGCILVRDPNRPREFSEVYADGKRLACEITHDMALEFATDAAKQFGVGESRSVNFDKERAKRDVKNETATVASKRSPKQAPDAEGK